jgi:hypothetical protein
LDPGEDIAKSKRIKGKVMLKIVMSRINKNVLYVILPLGYETNKTRGSWGSYNTLGIQDSSKSYTRTKKYDFEVGWVSFLVFCNILRTVLCDFSK